MFSTDEYKHLATLCRYAGFDFNADTNTISVDGIILPKASEEAYWLEIATSPEKVIAVATKEFNDIEEFMSVNGMTK